MSDIQFYKSFVFEEYHYSKYRVNDYTTGTGVRKHFFGRLVRGKARITMNDITLSLKAGEIFYIPKNAKYRSYWSPENNEQLTFHSLGFELFPLEENQSYILQKIECTAEETEYFDAICSNIGVNAENIGRLYMFLGSVSKRMITEDITREKQLSAKALDYMRTNTEYTVKELAEYCGMSESGVYAFFKRVFGKTPVDVKHQLTAKKAIDLLIRTDMSVEEISNRLGFGSSAYFRKVIKEQTGKTPSQIRKKIKPV